MRFPLGDEFRRLREFGRDVAAVAVRTRSMMKPNCFAASSRPVLKSA